MKNKISLVLTVYNGEKYLEEQLSSILAQSRQPDEVIILDDCSTDQTINLIEQFINRNNLLNWELHKNVINQGWRANFINGFQKTTGNLILCADQDDVWNERKIELMEKAFDSNPCINVLACNLIPLYEKNGQKLASFYVDKYGTNYIEKVNIQKYGLTVIRPGCTFCFKSNILPWIYKVWYKDLAHDETIWAIGLATDSLYILNESLIKFRRHGNNNSPSNRKSADIRLKRLECEMRKIDMLIMNNDKMGINEENLAYLDKLNCFYKLRSEALKEKSIKKMFGLIKNINLYSSINAWISDFLCLIK